MTGVHVLGGSVTDAQTPLHRRGMPPAAAKVPVLDPVTAGLLVFSALACAVTIASRVQPSEGVRDAATFAHLAFLVVGFGAVLTVDWAGLLWLFGRRELADVLRGAQHVHALIWIGFAGLVATGTLLDPDLTGTLTRVKLGLILLIGWNGVAAVVLERMLATGGPRRAHLLLSGASATVSQLAWWGAMLIGFLNAS